MSKNKIRRPADGSTYKSIEGIPPQRTDAQKTRCNAMEFAGRLYIQCHKVIGGLMEERLRRTPGAWRNWRAAVALLGRAVDAIYRTVPDDQFDRLNALFTRGRIDINLPKAADYGGDLLPVHGEALHTIVNTAVAHECAICFKSGGEIRSCPLAKALQGVIEPDSWESSGCPWRDQAMREEAK